MRWEELVLYMDIDDTHLFQDIVRRVGSLMGINVTKEWTSKATHVCVSKTAQAKISTALLKALMFKKNIVTEDWIYNDLMEADDRKTTVQDLSKNIEGITWEHFGPLEGPAKLNHNENREKLFKEVELIVFNDDQFDQLENLIKKGGGTIMRIDINEFEALPKTRFTHILLPPEGTIDKEQWDSVIDCYTRR